MIYLNNLHESMRRANNYSFRYKDGTAWDNTKRKTRKRMTPRGPYFKRMERAEHSRKGNMLLNELDDAITMLQKL